MFEQTRPRDFAWSRKKWDGHYARYLRDERVGQRYGEVCVQVLERLEHGPAGVLTRAADADEAAELCYGIVSGRIGPSDMMGRTGYGMELPLILHRLTGGHREAYYEAIARLPELNNYRPGYITMGPTGKCNVVCPDCIIGGAIFQKERQLLHKGGDIVPYLAQAEAAGVDRVSLCIGEPTYNTKILFESSTPSATARGSRRARW